MDKEQAQKTPKVTPKSFMTAGPTLHYSHKNAQRCGLLAVVAFSLSCSFWSKILTGSFWSISLDSIISPEAWRLGQAVISPISIDTRISAFKFQVQPGFYRSGIFVREFADTFTMPVDKLHRCCLSPASIQVSFYRDSFMHGP
jgi:hypothetical protein